LPTLKMSLQTQHLPFLLHLTAIQLIPLRFLSPKEIIRSRFPVQILEDIKLRFLIMALKPTSISSPLSTLTQPNPKSKLTLRALAQMRTRRCILTSSRLLKSLLQSIILQIVTWGLVLKEKIPAPHMLSVEMVGQKSAIPAIGRMMETNTP